MKLAEGFIVNDPLAQAQVLFRRDPGENPPLINVLSACDFLQFRPRGYLAAVGWPSIERRDYRRSSWYGCANSGDVATLIQVFLKVAKNATNLVGGAQVGDRVGD